MSAPRFERGQVIVEFAFAASVFLLLVLAIVVFGRALYTYDEVASAARLGSRWAIVNTSPPPSNCATAGGTCQQQIIDYMLSKTDLAASNLTTTITFGGVPYNPTSFACAAQPSPGCWINVHLSYAFSFGGLPLPTRMLTTSSQMVIATQY